MPEQSTTPIWLYKGQVTIPVSIPGKDSVVLKPRTEFEAPEESVRHLIAQRLVVRARPKKKNRTSADDRREVMLAKRSAKVQPKPPTKDQLDVPEKLEVEGHVIVKEGALTAEGVVTSDPEHPAEDVAGAEGVESQAESEEKAQKKVTSKKKK